MVALTHVRNASMRYAIAKRGRAGRATDEMRVRRGGIALYNDGDPLLIARGGRTGAGAGGLRG
jgi:hypothetical protein